MLQVHKNISSKTTSNFRFLNIMSHCNSCSMQFDQTLLMNCLRTGQHYQDFLEWKMWGSYPNLLEMDVIESKEDDGDMKRLSETVVTGYIRDKIIGLELRHNLLPPYALLMVVSKYYMPPTAKYTILWRYSGGLLNTPASTDEDAPDWPE